MSLIRTPPAPFGNSEKGLLKDAEVLTTKLNMAFCKLNLLLRFLGILTYLTTDVAQGNYKAGLFSSTER